MKHHNEAYVTFEDAREIYRDLIKRGYKKCGSISDIHILENAHFQVFFTPLTDTTDSMEVSYKSKMLLEYEGLLLNRGWLYESESQRISELGIEIDNDIEICLGSEMGA